MKKYRCTVCEWVYDPAVGDPDGGIAPGTQFEEIPEDWVCPVCGVGKDMFRRGCGIIPSLPEETARRTLRGAPCRL